MIESLQKIWDWLDGSKTTIGAIVLLFAGFNSEVIVGIWHYQAPWFANFISTLNWVGMTFSAVGVTHKVIKS